MKLQSIFQYALVFLAPVASWYAPIPHAGTSRERQVSLSKVDVEVESQMDEEDLRELLYIPREFWTSDLFQLTLLFEAKNLVGSRQYCKDWLDRDPEGAIACLAMIEEYPDRFGVEIPLDVYVKTLVEMPFDRAFEHICKVGLESKAHTDLLSDWLTELWRRNTSDVHAWLRTYPSFTQLSCLNELIEEVARREETVQFASILLSLPTTDTRRELLLAIVVDTSSDEPSVRDFVIDHLGDPAMDSCASQLSCAVSLEDPHRAMTIAHRITRPETRFDAIFRVLINWSETKGVEHVQIWLDQQHDMNVELRNALRMKLIEMKNSE